jgi:hypothetical protein
MNRKNVAADAALLPAAHMQMPYFRQLVSDSDTVEKSPIKRVLNKQVIK